MISREDLPMPYHVTCDCGHNLAVPESQRNAEIRCPQCGRKLPARNDTFESQHSSAILPPPIDPIALPESMHREPSTLPSAVRNYQRRHEQTVSLIATVHVAIVFVSLIPLLVVLWQGYASERPLHLERWAIFLVGLATLQFAYAIYLIQLPDWSSVWVLSAVTLLLSTAYATLMGIRLLTSRAIPLTVWLGMEGDQFTGGQEAGWCLIMVLLTATFSYFAGHFGMQWYRRCGPQTSEVKPR
jgi:hypothetical protein